MREAGGLVGPSEFRLPITGLEWGLLGGLAGALGVWLMRRRRLALTCAVIALIASLVDPGQRWLAQRSRSAVVLQEAMLEGTDLELLPGQLVEVQERSGARARVQAGRVASGWVPLQSIGFVVGS